MPVRRSVAVITTVAAASFASLGAAATAAGGWSLPVRLSAPGLPQAPLIAEDSAGDQTAAWTLEEPTEMEQFVVMSATRPAGSRAWSKPAAVSDLNAQPDSAQLAVAPSGAAVLAWSEFVREGRRGHRKLVEAIEARVSSSATAPWRPPAQISPRGQNTGEFAIGIDDRGRPVAVWTAGVAVNGPIESARGSTASGRWGAAKRVATAQLGGSALELAINAGGDAIATWQHQGPVPKRTGSLTPVVTYTVIAAERRAGQGWQRPLRIGRFAEPLPQPGGNIWGPATQQVTLDPDGDAMVAWSAPVSAKQLIEFSYRPADAPVWQPAVLLSSHAVGPVIATDASGNVTATWLDARNRVVTATRPAGDGTAFSPPSIVPRSAGAQLSWLSVNAHGDAVIAWLGEHGREFVSSRSGPGGSWGEPATIGSGGFPQAALNNRGDIAVIWQRLLSPRSGDAIEVAAYNAR